MLELVGVGLWLYNFLGQLTIIIPGDRVSINFSAIDPQKPNSFQISAYISATGHNSQNPSVVLVRGGRDKYVVTWCVRFYIVLRQQGISGAL